MGRDYSKGRGRNHLRCLFFAMILFFLSAEGFSQQVPYSNDFQIFLNNVNQIYIIPNGFNFTQMVTQYPTALAAVMGHYLGQQLRYAGQDPASLARVNSLAGEVQRYFYEVANACHGRDIGGKPADAVSLWNMCQAYISGGDGSIFRDFHVQRFQVPSMFVGQALPVVTPFGQANIQGVNGNQFNVFNAPAMNMQPVGQAPSGQANLEGQNGIQLNGFNAPAVNMSPPQHAAPVALDAPLQDSDIFGTWTNSNYGIQMTLWSQGDMILGRVSYSYQFNASKCAGNINWIPGDVSFKLKITKRETQDIMMEGQSLNCNYNGVNTWDNDSLMLLRHSDTKKPYIVGGSFHELQFEK